jgi:hypothetical protein
MGTSYYLCTGELTRGWPQGCHELVGSRDTVKLFSQEVCLSLSATANFVGSGVHQRTGDGNYKWLATWNGKPAAFTWKASADVILDKVRRCKELSETDD